MGIVDVLHEANKRPDAKSGKCGSQRVVEAPVVPSLRLTMRTKNGMNFCYTICTLVHTKDDDRFRYWSTQDGSIRFELPRVYPADSFPNFASYKGHLHFRDVTILLQYSESDTKYTNWSGHPGSSSNFSMCSLSNELSQ